MTNVIKISWYNCNLQACANTYAPELQMRPYVQDATLNTHDRSLYAASDL